MTAADLSDSQDAESVRARGLALLRSASTALRIGNYPASASRAAEAVSVMSQREGNEQLAAVARFQQALALMLLNRNQEALDVLGPAFAAGFSIPGKKDLSVDALTLRAELLGRLERWEEADEAAATLIDAIPGNTESERTARKLALSTRAQAATAMGDATLALELWDEVIACGTDPDSPEMRVDALVAKGSLLEEAGRLTEALAAYDAALSSRPARRTGGAEAKKRRAALLKRVAA